MSNYRILNYLTGISLVIFWWLAGCQSAKEEIPVEYQQTTVYFPQDDLDSLFHQIQMSGIFPDSKTFVDARPLTSPELILEIYQAKADDGTLHLKDFVNEYFQLPQPPTPVEVDTSVQMEEHLERLWQQLTRSSDSAHNSGSLLPLPYPYVVPGGRFREVYYWDSYFTMLGLLESDQDSLMWNMLNNFAHLIDTYGFIPNGNRSYYLGRSQPPFFSAMVMKWAEYHGMGQAQQFLPQMRQEYDFWMNGLDNMGRQKQAEERVLVTKDGKILNRYWDQYDRPRPESYREDYELAEEFDPDHRSKIYRDLRAGAESGWDYSSRWFSDGMSLDSIITTDIAPVDLNALMYYMEKSLGLLYSEAGEPSEAEKFDSLSQLRAEAFSSYFWDQSAGFFADYNFIRGATSGIYSAAGLVPLYFQLASEKQAAQCVEYLQQHLLFPGGVVSTTHNTGQQWDYPNGWAPQQWMAIQGLRHYGYDQLADDIARRWVELAEKVYHNTGKMMEKYNVVDLSLSAGGGEYPTQDGFGWTNGVTLALIAQLREAQ